MPRMYKDILMDYRRMEGVSTFPSGLYCLSETTVQMILALSESFYWVTRWQMPPEESPHDWTTSELEQIKTWAARLENELRTPIADCDQELNCLDCVDYAPNSARIEWTPDPFTQPDFVPEGWAYPPWFVVEEGSIPDITGAQVGDVLSTFDRFAFVDPDSYDREYPTFRVNWNGAAEVELHLLSVPQGGLAIIRLDDGDLNVVELNSYSVSDFASFIAALLELFDLTINGEIYEETVYEIKTETAGAHHVDVTLYPTANLEEFIGWGGGLRKITICGEVGIEPCEECDPMDVRQNEETPCILEKTEDGETWVEFANLQLCPPLIRQRPDGTIEYSTDDGETWTPVETDTSYDPLYTTPPPQKPRTESAPDKPCAAARNAALVYIQFANEMATLIENAGGALYFTVGQLALIVQNLLNFNLSASYFNNLSASTAFQLNATSYLTTLALNAVGAGVPSAQYLRESVDDESEQEAIYCALFCASDEDGNIDYETAIENLNAAVSADDIRADVVGLIELMGAGGMASAASATAQEFTSDDCDDCDCDETWCYTWDLTDTDGGWEAIVFGSADAAYTSGQGWGIGTNSSQEIIITRDFDSVAIDGFRVDFDASVLEGTNPYVLWKLNGTTLESSPVLAPQNYFEVTYDAQIVTNLWVGYNSAWTYSAGTDTTTRKIVAFQMWGRGENPFGEDNCEVT